VKIFSILFPVFSLVLVGYLYSRKYRPSLGSINQAVLFVFLPALVFDIMSGQDFQIYTYRWRSLSCLALRLPRGLSPSRIVCTGAVLCQA